MTEPWRCSLRIAAAVTVVSGALSGLNADTPVRGRVSGQWTAENSPYVAVGDLYLPPGDRLVIGAGVEVLFLEGTTFYVHGVLEATGAEGDSVRFAAYEDGGTWGGLRFINAVRGTLDLCVVTGGRRNYPDRPAADTLKSGGGVFIWRGEVTLARSRISDNAADGFGGGVGVWQSRPLISDCVVARNVTTTQGGGINLDGGSAAHIVRCAITSNQAGWGGGGVNLAGESHAALEDCFIAYNTAGTGGGLSLYGGDPVIRRCTFKSNSAAVMGGGAYFRDPGNDPLLEWCDFIDNRAVQHGENSGLGGGLLLRFNTGAEVRFCRFFSNSAVQGGGIFVQQEAGHGPRCRLHHNLLRANTARIGGGLAMSPNVGQTPLVINQCTFLDNFSDGEGVHTAFIPRGSLMTFNTCIIWGPEPHFRDPANVQVRYSQVQRGWGGVGNSPDNPRWFPLDSAWCLLRGDSPCRDSGDPALPTDPDRTRADRGWQPFPHNAWDGLEADTIHADLEVGTRQVVPVVMENRSGVPFFASVADDRRLSQVHLDVDVSRLVGDQDVTAVAFTQGDLFIAGGASGTPPGLIYRLSRNLELRGEFEQPGYGDSPSFYDLGSDGSPVIYGSHESVVDFSADGEYGDTYSGPDSVEVFTGVAVRSHPGQRNPDIFVSGREGSIYRTDAELFEQQRFPMGAPMGALGARHNLNALYTSVATPEGDYLALANLDDSLLTPLFRLPPPEAGYTLGGIEVTAEWVEGEGTLLGVWRSDSGNDRLFAAKLYTAWLAPVPRWRLLMPGDRAEWDVVFTGEYATAGEHWENFTLMVNGWDFGAALSAHLVARPASVGTEPSRPPADIGRLVTWPHPFNASTSLWFSLNRSVSVWVRVYDAQGRECRRWSLGLLGPGLHQMPLSLPAYPSGVYCLAISTPSATQALPLVLLK